MFETQGGTRNRARDLPKKGSAFILSSNHWTTCNVCNVNIHNFLAISKLDFDNSGEPGPQAKGVNHLETALRQLHATHRASSCAKRGGHVQLCSKPRGGTRNRTRDLPKKGSAFITSSHHWTIALCPLIRCADVTIQAEVHHCVCLPITQVDALHICMHCGPSSPLTTATLPTWLLQTTHRWQMLVFGNSFHAWTPTKDYQDEH